MKERLEEAIRQINHRMQELERLRQFVLDSPEKQNALALPLEALVLRVDDHWIALSVAQVEEVVPMVWVSTLPRAPDAIRGTINFRGHLVPVLDLHGSLGGRLPPLASGMCLVIVTAGVTRRLALVVDEVEGVEEFDSQSAEPEPVVSSLPGFVHRLLRSDRRPVALLDPAGLLAASELDLLDELLSGAADGSEGRS